MLIFDPEGGHLNPVGQLVGKTIAAVIPLDDPESPEDWILEFTDGDRVQVTAQYSDSAVFWQKPE